MKGIQNRSDRMMWDETEVRKCCKEHFRYFCSNESEILKRIKMSAINVFKKTLMKRK